MSIKSGDFAFVAQMVKQRSAIDLKSGKEYLVESRLAPLARGLDTDLDGLITRLRQGNESLRDSVVDALTTNETSFFRDVKPFDAFAEHMLPEIAAAGRARQIAVWSAACSSGQEAYSLAMLFTQWAEANPGWTCRITGTDISPQMIRRAQQGRYSQMEVNRGLPAPMLVKYFEQVGRDWVVHPQLRDMCRFVRGNLVQPSHNPRLYDVVFLRNVLIYFDSATKHQVLSNVREALRPGGMLVLGGAEATLTLDGAFQRVELGRAAAFRHRGGTT